MSNTNNEVVSRVINGANALTKDVHISRRYVLNTARTKAGFLIAQKFDEGDLFLDDSIYTHIDCFEMVPDNIVKCDIVEFRRCQKLMKSKKKLPKLLSGSFGTAIVSVTSLDGNTKFDRTSPSKFYTESKLPNASLFSSNKYYDKNGYLYLLNSSVEAVNVVVLTFEEDVANEVSGCTECDECKSLWDYDFKCPEKLMEAVIKDTLMEVLGTNVRIPADSNPNNDPNQKTQTEQ